MFYVSIDFVISILEAVCCQMFFDIFADENWENRGKGIKSCIIMALGLVCFGMGKLLSTDFLILKEAIVIAATAVIMILIAGFELKKAAILASLFQGLLLAMEYLAYIFMQIIVSDEINVSNMEGTLSTFIAIIDMLLLFLCVVLIRRMFKGQKTGYSMMRSGLNLLYFQSLQLLH